MTTYAPTRDDYGCKVEDAVDVGTINRLLQDAVQEERRLHRELFDTVAKKEQISQRLSNHQVRHILVFSLEYCNVFKEKVSKILPPFYIPSYRKVRPSLVTCSQDPRAYTRRFSR